MDKIITVAVTELEYEKGKAVFEKTESAGIHCVSVPHGENELAQAIRENNIRYVIAGDGIYRDTLYDALSEGSLLARFGVGFDGIDLKKATKKGILCTNTRDVLENSVAEFTFGLMLSASRHLVKMDNDTKNGKFIFQKGTELYGKRLAVIGCGSIGSRVACIASAGFGMEVIGCDNRNIDIEKIKHEYGFCTIVKEFTQAVEGAEFVTLHIPGTPDTIHYINKDRLSVMAENSLLINTARGVVVDENHLYEALVDGVIGGAALDVFENEPYFPVKPDKDLRTLPNVIMTPHAGSATSEACERMAKRALNNVYCAINNDNENMDLLNKEVLSRIK
ncbi:MAG: D-glycerate dehydrogenase [Candidatus Latescibacteria bacterium]|nr:D-glycerate dehydrogenase [Candidatus Latescibacterota bacterium]